MFTIYPDEDLEMDRGGHFPGRTERERRHCISVGEEQAPQDDNARHCVATECTLENMGCYVIAVCVCMCAHERVRERERQRWSEPESTSACKSEQYLELGPSGFYCLLCRCPHGSCRNRCSKK